MNIALLTLTVAASGALEANRFVTQAGAYPAAGGAAFGVARTGATAAGDLVPVDVQGTTMAEAGAAISDPDVALMVDAAGRVVPLAGAGKSPVGRSMQAAASGALLEILLVPGAGLVSA